MKTISVFVRETKNEQTGRTRRAFSSFEQGPFVSLTRFANSWRETAAPNDIVALTSATGREAVLFAKRRGVEIN